MLDTEAVRKELVDRCTAAGGQRAWADANKISPQYVSDVICGTRAPGPAIRDALGIERVTFYRHKKARRNPAGR